MQCMGLSVAYPGRSSRVLIAEGCRGIRRGAGEYGGVQGNTEGCRGIRRGAGEYGGVQGNTEGCRGIRRGAGEWGGVQGNGEGCRGIEPLGRTPKTNGHH